MPSRINIFLSRLWNAKTQCVFHHAALALIVTRHRRKHRQTGGIARGPPGRPQIIGSEIELRSVRRLPAVLRQFGLPHFPDRSDSGGDNDGVTVASGIIYVHLPLLQRQPAGITRPGFDRHIGWNRVTTIRIRSAIQIGFIGIIKERNRDSRLVIRNQHEVHLRECAQRLAAR